VRAARDYEQGATVITSRCEMKTSTFVSCRIAYLVWASSADSRSAGAAADRRATGQLHPALRLPAGLFPVNLLHSLLNIVIGAWASRRVGPLEQHQLRARRRGALGVLA